MRIAVDVHPLVGPWGGVQRYIVELNNEEHNAFNFDTQLQRKDFTSAAIRRLGKR